MGVRRVLGHARLATLDIGVLEARVMPCAYGRGMAEVTLRGGSFDGQLVDGPPAPEALRLGAREGDKQWTELYTYVDGRPGEMIFMERKDEA